MMGGGPFPRKEVRARAKPVRRGEETHCFRKPERDALHYDLGVTGSMCKELCKAAHLVHNQMSRLPSCSCESECSKTEYDGFEHQKSAPPDF